jgi:hypothetical protein
MTFPSHLSVLEAKSDKPGRRRTGGSGTLGAQPLGVAVGSASLGAISAEVGNSEIVSAGLNTRLVVVLQGAVHRETQIEPMEKPEFIRIEDRQSRSKNARLPKAISFIPRSLRFGRGDGLIAIAPCASRQVPHR